MDFLKIERHKTKNKTINLIPNFKIGRSSDLMIKSKTFYAIWDEKKSLWSRDEYDVTRLVDEALFEEKAKYDSLKSDDDPEMNVKTLKDFSTKMWSSFKVYLNQSPDNYHSLDDHIAFANTVMSKDKYVTRRLSYSLEKGSIDSYEKIISVLYSPSERQKIEWAIGSIICGDSKSIQKFYVFYGDTGAGKSTILNIIQQLFEGYHISFDAKAITTANNQFATSVFATNPLIAIQHDGDLSKIEDNSKFNSIISHEAICMNEKFKSMYDFEAKFTMFIGSNKPVKITDAKSGLIRRLIDISPTGNKIPVDTYNVLTQNVKFELGAIAQHCLDVYKSLGKNYYNQYIPINMMLRTDMFYNFVENHRYMFKELDGISLAQAYAMYKEYCDESEMEHKNAKYRFRDEFKNYFKEFHERIRINNEQIRNYFKGFIDSKFEKTEVTNTPQLDNWLVFDQTTSILDLKLESNDAQLATNEEMPKQVWIKVKTKLKSINTKQLHYVKLDTNHIVIDLDLKVNGVKDLEANIQYASRFPKTYAELSKSGKGIHLHYLYSGDVTQLCKIYDEDVEIKTLLGDSALRRKLTYCNNIEIATISSGLPLKGVSPMIEIKNEKILRKLIRKALCKDIHPGTKSNIDFIHKILEDAYNGGQIYDVTDLRPSIMSFANNSTNQADYCLKLFLKMKFKSDIETINEFNKEKPMVFFDVEVFPNLFVLVWKKIGSDPIKMINPTAEQIEPLFNFNLIGFNCRRYDNHILYARYIGYTVEQLYTLSQRIIGDSKNCFFSEAYNISYTDIYDFSSEKKSLKKFEIELGIKHLEIGLPWDEPVPEHLWETVADYCCNDVIATEAVFQSRKQDYNARLILSELSGLSPNDTTQQHAAKILFGDDKNPQAKFVYTDLSIMFPGYKYENGKSFYKGEEVGEGGWVYAVPGMYANVPVLDVTSMHPNSLIQLNVFGPYTKVLEELVQARVAIKNERYDEAKKMLGGILEKYLKDKKDSKGLSYALKIFINIIYGLTSAKFDNKFKDPRNIDNLVAKRGALFMIDLRDAVKEKGFTVAHIKTDSIKIPNATPEIIQFVMDFGKKYGYSFEHENTYDKFCLVNDTVYIAKNGNEWEATGAQFAHPVVYKTLFSKEEIVFDDYCETKSVTSAIYLHDENTDTRSFVGKVGSFVPVLNGGGTLQRIKDNKYYAISGTKGYKFIEKTNFNDTYEIDKRPSNKLVEEALAKINKFGNYDWFVSEKSVSDDIEPWYPPCGTKQHSICADTCPCFTEDAKCKLGYNVLPF